MPRGSRGEYKRPWTSVHSNCIWYRSIMYDHFSSSTISSGPPPTTATAFPAIQAAAPDWNDSEYTTSAGPYLARSIDANAGDSRENLKVGSRNRQL